jgi:hypothetical protein
VGLINKEFMKTTKKELKKLYEIARARSRQLDKGDFKLQDHRSIWENGVEPLMMGKDGNPVRQEAKTFTCDLCGSTLGQGTCNCQGDY